MGNGDHGFHIVLIYTWLSIWGIYWFKFITLIFTLFSRKASIISSSCSLFLVLFSCFFHNLSEYILLYSNSLLCSFSFHSFYLWFFWMHSLVKNIVEIQWLPCYFLADSSYWLGWTISILHSINCTGFFFFLWTAYSEEGWYYFSWAVSLHRKWNYIGLAWGKNCHCFIKEFFRSVANFNMLVLFINLKVLETKDRDVICLVKNTATLAGLIFTMHVSQVHVNMPTLNENDKLVILDYL